MSATESLFRKPSPSTKVAIVHAFFGGICSAIDIKNFEQYFACYVSELESFLSNRYGHPSNELSVKSHIDLLKVFECLKHNPSLTRAELRPRLKQIIHGVQQADLDLYVELAIRLGFMLNVRQPQELLLARRAPIVQWYEQMRLREVIDASFPRSRWSLTAKESRIHPMFTAAFMVDVCGLKISWTACLDDHLSLRRDSNAPNQWFLHIFPHKRCLQMLLETSDWSQPWRNQEGYLLSAQIPKEVLIETVQSLNLLFPHGDSATNILLRKEKKDFQEVAPFEGPKLLNLMEFDHWRDRLLEVYDVVFTSPPASWRQLMLDRRNPQQFWTFWIALLILGLTMVQTGTGIKQAI